MTTPAPISSAPESLTNFANPSKAFPLARKSSISNTRSPSPKNSLDTIMSYTLPCVNDSTFVVYTSPAMFFVCVFFANTTGTSKISATTQAIPIPDASIVRILLISSPSKRFLNSLPISRNNFTSI